MAHGPGFMNHRMYDTGSNFYCSKNSRADQTLSVLMMASEVQVEVKLYKTQRPDRSLGLDRRKSAGNYGTEQTVVNRSIQGK